MLGFYPPLKPYMKHLPDSFFRHGLQAVDDLGGITVARVNELLQSKNEKEGRDLNIDRVELLERLMENKDENGGKLGREELTPEALTLLIAESDITSNTSCALSY